MGWSSSGPPVPLPTFLYSPFWGSLGEICPLMECLSCAIVKPGSQEVSCSQPGKIKKPQILVSPVKVGERNRRRLGTESHVLYSLCGRPKHSYVPVTHLPHSHWCAPPPPLSVTAAGAGQVAIDKEARVPSSQAGRG